MEYHWTIFVLQSRGYYDTLSSITNKIPLLFILLKRSKVFVEFPTEILFKIISFSFDIVIRRHTWNYTCSRCEIYKFVCCNKSIHQCCMKRAGVHFLSKCPFDDTHDAVVDDEYYNVFPLQLLYNKLLYNFLTRTHIR